MGPGSFIQYLTFFLSLAYFLNSAFGSIASPQPCDRQCVEKDNRICEYDFAIENYFVLSKACYLCPFVKSDCYRPHCVATNGHLREILTINRQMPGPTISVCRGDTIRVLVKNKMEDGGSTSLHWHGIHQDNSVYMDGVPSLTQCPIAPFETFEYNFVANNSGTHWYHSHTGVQMGDGLLGALIIREPNNREPHKFLYDEDRSDHVIIIQDWIDATATHRYFEEMHDIWKWPVVGLATLVNGRGALHDVQDVQNITNYPQAPPPTKTPRETFTVTQGKRYRFRVISASPRCFHQFMIDGHQMTMIASDGEPFSPVTVGSFIINPGERYDFVLNADKSGGNFWMKMLGLGDCTSTEANGIAILNYAGSDVESLPNGNVDDFTQPDRILNAIPLVNTGNNHTYVQDLRQESSAKHNYTDEVVDHTYYINLRYQTNDNSIYAHSEYYPNPSRKGIITPTLNNITMDRPPIPLTSQWDQFNESMVCNSYNINTDRDCHDKLCQCFHSITVGLGQVVELFMFSHTTDPHSMHLHGYSFRVMGAGMFPAQNETYADVSMAEIRRRDKAGHFPRNYINPILKDTLNVDARGGYAIIRFKANNPGPWFFHCHNEGHMMQGMAMVIRVGTYPELPKIPENFPTCGGFSYPRRTCSVTSGANAVMTSPSFRVFLMATLLICLLFRYIRKY